MKTILLTSVLLGLSFFSSCTMCNSTSCKGCCDPTGMCQTGAASEACGYSGSACVACESGYICSNGGCVHQDAACNASNCPGCCAAGVCKTGMTTTACGKNAGTCQKCTGTQQCVAAVCQ